MPLLVRLTERCGSLVLVQQEAGTNSKYGAVSQHAAGGVEVATNHPLCPFSIQEVNIFLTPISLAGLGEYIV
jgi:hypothetical protein